MNLDKRLQGVFKKCSFRYRLLKYRPLLDSLNSFFLSFHLCHCFSVIETFSGFAAHRIELNSAFRFQQIDVSNFLLLCYPKSRIFCIMWPYIHNANLLVDQSKNYLLFVGSSSGWFSQKFCQFIKPRYCLQTLKYFLFLFFGCRFFCNKTKARKQTFYQATSQTTLWKYGI